jgi:hypothetical protein
VEDFITMPKYFRDNVVENQRHHAYGVDENIVFHPNRGPPAICEKFIPSEGPVTMPEGAL